MFSLELSLISPPPPLFSPLLSSPPLFSPLLSCINSTAWISLMDIERSLICILHIYDLVSKPVCLIPILQSHWHLLEHQSIWRRCHLPKLERDYCLHRYQMLLLSIKCQTFFYQICMHPCRSNAMCMCLWVYSCTRTTYTVWIHSPEQQCLIHHSYCSAEQKWWHRCWLTANIQRYCTYKNLSSSEVMGVVTA